MEEDLLDLPSKQEVIKKMIKIITSELGDEISKEKIQEIHELISKYNEIDTMQKFENIKIEIIQSIIENDIEFFKLLISEEVNFKNVATFKINKEKKEASLFNVSNNIDNFTVPQTIKYNNEDYLVTSILKCDINDTLKFDKNSAVYTFYSSAFAYSNVKRIFIPASLRKIKKGCFFAMDNLKTFVISPLNGQFIYKDDQYLLGKTDEKSDNFDILLYALRDISEAKIPSNVKIISSYAFYDCLHLKEVIFEENSELEIIEESAFSISTIENIFIPPKVTKILKYAFSDCCNLREVNISPDSKLEIIDECVFAETMIEEFFIPANVRELKDGS